MKRRTLGWICFGLIISLTWGYVLFKRYSPQVSLPPAKDFRVVVISDLNSQYGSTEYDPEVDLAIALIPSWQPDLVLCGGDMIAGQKTSLTPKQIESMWWAFDAHITAPLRQERIPFGFTIGNHDGSGAIKKNQLVFQQERELARDFWQQQDTGLNFNDRDNFPFYYSFQQQNIFFLVWDASTAEISPQQLAWVRQSLSSPAARQAKARIVIGHLPLYPVAKGKNKSGEYLERGDELHRLLAEYKVDLYVSGHHHAYYPGRVKGLNLLHAGALGQGARQLIGSDSSPQKTITAIDWDFSNSQAHYTTYDATTWKEIDLQMLPDFIPYQDDKIFRQDAP